MSTAASRSAYQEAVPTMRGKRAIVYNTVYQAVHVLQQGGRTIDELCRELGWRYSTTSARVFELAEAGLIRDAGVRSRQTVWAPTRAEEVEAVRARRAAARDARKSPEARRLEQLERAVKRVRDHKAELFEDGVRADLAAEGIVTMPGAFKAGYNEAHRELLELLEAL